MNTRKTGVLAALLVGAVLMVSGADTVYAAESTYAGAVYLSPVLTGELVQLKKEWLRLVRAAPSSDDGLREIRDFLASRILPLSPPYRRYLLDGEGIGGESAGLDYFIFKYGSSALDCEVLRMLINAGAKVKGPESNCPLSRAIQRDNTAAVQMLLEAGAEADIPSSAGIHAWAPLHYAVFFACPEIIRLLIKHGADVHRETEGIRAFNSTKYRDLKHGTRLRGSTPLNLAVQANHVGAVEALIDAGADIERADSRGNRPRDFVRTNGTTHPRIAELVTPPPGVAPRPSVAERRGDASVYADMSGQYTEMSSWKHPAT